MFEALRGIACFVTATVSFIYGTRIAWACGKKCNFQENPEEKKHAIAESLPAAALVYLFGFLIVFSLSINGFVTIVVSSLTSAILLAGMVVTMAMPELKRRPPSKHQESAIKHLPRGKGLPTIKRENLRDKEA